MKIAVTGATGQLGRIIISKLKEKVSSEKIIAIVRSKQKAADLGVEIREADYEQPATLEKALTDVNTLLLISGSEVGKRTAQHINVIEAAKKAGVKRIVYTSLLHADTSSLSLAGEHLATEAALRASGIPFTILRNGWYTENYLGSASAAIANGAFIGSAGEGKINSATRLDYAQAAVAVLTSDEHENKVYELAGDQAYTLTDLAAEVSRQTNKNIPYQNLPEGEYAQLLTSFGLPEGLAQAIAGWDISASIGDLSHDGRELATLIARPTTTLSKAVEAALSSAA